MAKQKSGDDGNPKRPREPREPGQPGERPRHNPEGREHEVHKEILARRMRGGPEPTPDAYARALEEWKNLPGSVVRPPTDISEQSESDQPESSDQKKPESPTQKR